MMGPTSFEIPNYPDIVEYIYGPIEDELDYVDLIQKIRYAPDGQQIILHLNSPGGNLNVAIAIVGAIQQSLGTVITMIDGEASSAAALIWLAGHQKALLSRHVYFMLHTATTGMYGKLPEIKSGLDVMLKVIDSLLAEYATQILTPEEFADVKKGVDVYLTGDEIMKRLPGEETKLPHEED